jgi:hypothetical protein
VTSCHSLAGDQCTAHTAARWPLRVWVNPPDTMSHSITCRGVTRRGQGLETPQQEDGSQPSVFGVSQTITGTAAAGGSTAIPLPLAGTAPATASIPAGKGVYIFIPTCVSLLPTATRQWLVATADMAAA